MVDSFAPETIVVAVAVGALAGMVRGVTGFGGAMVMSPPLALLLGPLIAVPAVLLLESLAAIPMLVQTRRLVRWRVIGPIIVAACVAFPIGGYVLVNADPHLLRRAIAATVIVFALLLLRGWRYAGAQRTTTSAGLGALAGTMAGATSISGPPVILYLLAGPDPIDTTRANLTFYVAASAAAGIAMLWGGGVLDPRAVWIAAAVAPAYLGGTLVGTRLFARFDDRRFRQFTLIFMMGVSLAILLA
jgi:uncharacterized membrane protein YfcA